MWVVCHVLCPLTVYVQVLESVQYWLHQTVGEAGQLVIPQFEPLQRVEIFKGLIRYLVDTKNVLKTQLFVIFFLA